MRGGRARCRSRATCVAAASKTLDAVLDRVAADMPRTLAPAIDRVWRDEVDELRRDLGIWVQKLADDAARGSRGTSSSASA